MDPGIPGNLLTTAMAVRPQTGVSRALDLALRQLVAPQQRQKSWSIID